MKNQLLFLAFLIVTSVNAQVPGEKLVPAAVKTQFKVDHPNASLKKWEVYPNIKEYVAVFREDNLLKRGRYKNTGTAISLLTHYGKAVIPTAVLTNIPTLYPEYTVNWATEWNNFKTGNHFFEVRLSKSGTILKVYVNPDGTVIKNNEKMKQEVKDSGESTEEAPKE